jgi:RHS repeat-associated protein
VAAGRIDLSWTAATDNVAVAGYNVYRDAVKINTVPVGSTSYSDTGLTPGVNHTYTISAIDAAANESAVSGTYTGAAGSGAVTTTYTYDPENRLTQLQSDSNVIGTYAYDGAGNRYGKTAGGVTTAYTLDLASSLPQVLTETAGSAVTAYAYGAGPLELDRSTTYWYLADTLGSVRLVTDSTGATPATYAYSAFGSTRNSTGTLANEVRFTGERTDTESGLEFLRARTYDPSVGTFLQRDSWGITPTSSQSIDAYAYTANNPVNAIDPSGRCDWNPFGGGSCLGEAANTVTQAGQVAVQKGSDFAGGVGNAWAQTGGGIVNNAADWVQKNPATTALLVTAGACAFAIATGGALTPQCVSMAYGAAIGAGTYTGGVTAGNYLSGKGLLDGFNTEHLSLNMIVGGVSNGTGWAVSKGISSLASGGSSVALSTAERLAIRSGIGGPASAAVTLVSKVVTNTASPLNAFSPLIATFGPLAREAATYLAPLRPKLPILRKLLPGLSR